jgi:hypothetical protein
VNAVACQPVSSLRLVVVHFGSELKACGDFANLRLSTLVRERGQGGREPPLTRGMARRRNHTPCAAATRSLVSRLSASQEPSSPASPYAANRESGKGGDLPAALRYFARVLDD